jgi:pimeloyl-ACP methyl ester carboxylesterase
MILWLFAALAALAIAVWLLAQNAHAYTKRVEAQWPATGRFIEANGARLHVRETGPEGAPRILLVHGAGSNLLELWTPLADAFTPQHRVIAYDRPGMGYSGRTRGAHKLAAQARAAASVLEATGAGPAVVVGHSLGAAVSLRLAMDFPHLVRGLVLVAPAGMPHLKRRVWWTRLSATPVLGNVFCTLVIPWMAPIASGPGLANNFWPSAVPANYKNETGLALLFRPKTFRANAQDVCATHDEFDAQSPRYAELFTPTIIVTAEKDRIISAKRHARALASTLPAAELVIAPDTGHMPHRLRTDLVIAAIRRVNEMASTPTQS